MPVAIPRGPPIPFKFGQIFDCSRATSTCASGEFNPKGEEAVQLDRPRNERHFARVFFLVR
jgi:hypothetical protein